jgi:hypothetical protein
MTSNTFIFSWDTTGIESIISIAEYESIEQENLLRMISGNDTVRNPLHSIVQNLLLRARYNTHRHYEIYSVACDTNLDEKFWQDQWNNYPQETADLIRARGHKLYSDRVKRNFIKIT